MIIGIKYSESIKQLIENVIKDCSVIITDVESWNSKLINIHNNNKYFIVNYDNHKIVKPENINNITPEEYSNIEPILLLNKDESICIIGDNIICDKSLKYCSIFFNTENNSNNKF